MYERMGKRMRWMGGKLKRKNRKPYRKHKTKIHKTFVQPQTDGVGALKTIFFIDV